MIARKALELEDKGEAYAVITFVSGKGHLPQEPGAKALVTAAGLHAGTVGGGIVEARAISDAQAMLREARSEPVLVTWNLQRDLGMTCGGEMTFLLETVFPRAWNVVVHGAGHVGQALARLLSTLDCRVHVVDARREWTERLPAGTIVHDSAPELPRGAFHVVMTQDHATDVPILAALAREGEHPYVGVIGSKAKAAKLRGELRALGVSEIFLEKPHCPIGLPIGSNTPPEIAVSIVAQLLEVRDRRG
jgi:xanthine dehydrogenase accessory factor